MYLSNVSKKTLVEQLGAKLVERGISFYELALNSDLRFDPNIRLSAKLCSKALLCQCIENFGIYYQQCMSRGPRLKLPIHPRIKGVCEYLRQEFRRVVRESGLPRKDFIEKWGLSVGPMINRTYSARHITVDCYLATIPELYHVTCRLGGNTYDVTIESELLAAKYTVSQLIKDQLAAGKGICIDNNIIIIDDYYAVVYGGLPVSDRYLPRIDLHHLLSIACWLDVDFDIVVNLKEPGKA